MTMASLSIQQPLDAAKNSHWVDRSVSTQANNFNPYLIAIPGSSHNSSTLIISAGNVEEQILPVYLAIDQGPTSHKHSYTMSFDTNQQAYIYTLDDFFSTDGVVGGSIEVTTTQQTTTTILSSGQRNYERWPVLADTPNQFQLKDGNLSVFMDPSTLPAELAFLAVVETLAPVDAPAGWQSLSQAYSIQASGAVALADKPYLLTLRYRPELLHNTSPESLAIFWFYSASHSWQNLGGNVRKDFNEVVLSTRQFGTFMLFAPASESTPTVIATNTATPTSTPTAIPTPTFTATDLGSYLPLIMK